MGLTDGDAFWLAGAMTAAAGVHSPEPPCVSR